MTPHDQQRFADLIADFVDGCGVAPPFQLVVIGANGSVVSRYTDSDVEPMCGRTDGSEMPDGKESRTRGASKRYGSENSGD
jgi:hypothetical protein